MAKQKIVSFLKEVINNIPYDWLKLTTHRLDIYDESQAKVQFLDLFDGLYTKGTVTEQELSQLPTAYDYIRLGHPLSSVLEWALANEYNLPAGHVISFSSKTTPILAILRKNLIDGKETHLIFEDGVPSYFDVNRITSVYGYNFSTHKADEVDCIPQRGDTGRCMCRWIHDI